MQKRSKLLQHLADVDTNVLLVLRAHLFAEQILNAILVERMGATDKQLEKKPFSKKLSDCHDPQWVPKSVQAAMNELNRLRICCVHHFQYSPTRAEVLGLFDSMSSELVYDRSTIDLPSVFARFAGAMLNQFRKARIRITLD